MILDHLIHVAAAREPKHFNLDILSSRLSPKVSILPQSQQHQTGLPSRTKVRRAQLAQRRQHLKARYGRHSSNRRFPKLLTVLRLDLYRFARLLLGCLLQVGLSTNRAVHCDVSDLLSICTTPACGATCRRQDAQASRTGPQLQEEVPLWRELKLQDLPTRLKHTQNPKLETRKVRSSSNCDQVGLGRV